MNTTTICTSVQNPLMQPVQFNGQVYFTSQHFHSHYKSNAGDKYSSLSSFNKLLRSIETYDKYVDNGDIVELVWSDAKKLADSNLDSVFKSTTYKPLLLINATAQLALSHHLDDEISKTISVAVNAQAAASSKADMRYISQQTKAALSLVKLLGLEGNQAILGASRAVKKVTGYSPLELAGIELESESKEIAYKPGDIGVKLGGLSAQKVNKMLEERGYQTCFRDSDNKPRWEPTEKGKAFGRMCDVERDNGTGNDQQWKWFSSIVEQLKSLEVVV